jgi:uncharacterized integral membrane protein
VPEAEAARERREVAGWIAAGLIVLALLAFVVQNGRRVKVEWLFWDVEIPLWLLVVLVAVAGAVLARVGGWLLRRRRNRD